MPEWMSIRDTKHKIDNLSAEEVTSSYLDTIEKSSINAFTNINKKAIEDAKYYDKNQSDLPLAGVPISIKDNISTKGIPTTCSSRMLENYIPPFNAHVIEKLYEAGAIIIGKTNMDEFAMGGSTETCCGGTTFNPWDTSRVPGGSSGGSAAALAAGESPISLGSDTGGSVRSPASYCGVVAMKPTYGTISRYGLISYSNSLEQIGPMATCVEDIAHIMDVIAGYDNRDSTSIKRDINYSDAIINDSEGMKIGVPTELISDGINPKVEKIVWDAIHKMEDLGAIWKEVSLPTTKYALPAYYILAMSDASSNLARFDGTRYGLQVEGNNWHVMASKTRAQGFGDEVKRRILLGTYALSAGYHDKYYVKALKVRTLVKNDFDRAFNDVDVLMGPTMADIAFKVGEKIEDPLSIYMTDINNVPVNLAGVPSMSIPCGFADKMPVGLQIIGNTFDESSILRCAYTFEQNTNHHRKRPDGVN
ncbi:Asp-tRNA(Asn)/Glu-tRNA(Gln) amidotransferase subunit GatA [Methanosalsum natronophilum]|uniref:Glutamyl-tRNA(Gln) amidotransferase subunit A n=1 Tax=Methanosalsum natronophilum TaxID=768733 RepID=A0A3R7YG65_9EURY|nr:MAG: Asp-tRNA(Asn)/Glu-tRNA(Gln) amidotransferase subunit GatA [Methanosalsum natronophilum]